MIRTAMFSILAVLLAGGSAMAGGSSLDGLRGLVNGAPVGVIATANMAGSVILVADDDDDDGDGDDDGDA